MPHTKIYTTHIVRLSGIIASDSIVPPGVFPLLTGTDGDPRPDGTYIMTFSLYNTPLGGRPVWNETHEVVLGFGVFCVDLGAQVSLPGEARNPYWISIQVEGEREPVKRHPFFFGTYDMSFISAMAV